MNGPQQPRPVINQVEHRRSYAERKAAGLVQINPKNSGLASPQALPRVTRPNPVRTSQGPLTLAEQLQMARQSQAAGGAVSVTGQPAAAPAAPAQRQRPNPAAVTVRPEAPVVVRNVLPPAQLPVQSPSINLWETPAAEVSVPAAPPTPAVNNPAGPANLDPLADA